MKKIATIATTMPMIIPRPPSPLELEESSGRLDATAGAEAEGVIAATSDRLMYNDLGLWVEI